MNYKLNVIAGLPRNPLIIFYLFFIILASFLFSCKDKTVDYGLDNYYVEIATAQNENTYLSDNGKMIIATSNESNKAYTLGDRVLLNYTLLSTDTVNDSFNVRINGSAKIPQGKLTLANDSIIRSSIKEPIRLESIWLGSHYLNMQFYLNYMSQTHKIGLLADSAGLESDTLRMYFIHDPNNDPPGYPTHTYLSFDLKDVLGDPKKARPITVQINTNDYGNKTYGFEY